jgi:hypothetical protein
VGTLHYLNWDREQSNTGPARDLFHRLHGLNNEIPEEVKTDFDSLYREVAEVETDDPEQAFREWNRGSGQESIQFRELRYCEPCDQYMDTPGDARMHAQENHGVMDVERLPDYIHGERSMSVGDVLETADEYHICRSIGFQKLQLRK